MKNMNLKDEIINAYREYIEEEGLEDTLESIDLYISTLWYDLIDDIEINREMFSIDKNVDDYITAKMIEKMIKEVLINRI